MREPLLVLTLHRLIFGFVLCLGLVAGAKDFRTPFYTVGFTTRANGTMDPVASTFLKSGSAIALSSGTSLADFRDLDFIGTLLGSWFGETAQVPACCAYQIAVHETSGTPDKIVCAIPHNAGWTKAVIVQLTETTAGTVSAQALMARYHNGAENYMEKNFFSMDSAGTVSGLESAVGAVAESAGGLGVGVYGFTATKMVPTGTAKLMFADCTLDDLRGHFFSGLAMGIDTTFALPMEGAQVEFTDDADGHATRLRVTMQVIGLPVEAATIELTNGIGGVYAVNVSERAAGTPAGEGVGVFALAATDGPVTPQGTGFLSSSDRLIWPKGTLDNVVDVRGWHHGSWLGRSDAVQGFYLRRGWGTDATLEFESRSYMGTEFRSATVVLTQRADGVYGRVERFAYGAGSYLGPVSYLNGGTSVTIATAPDLSAYGVAGLCGRVVAPTDLALTAGTNIIEDAFTATRARVTADAPAALSIEAPTSVRYWDFTDATAPVTVLSTLTNTSVTAGRELVLAAAPQNCQLSVAADNTLTLPDLSVLDSCGLHARGRVKFRGGNFTSLPKDLATVSELELAGACTVTGGDQGTSTAWSTDGGFVWNSGARVVVSGPTTFVGGRNLSTANDGTVTFVITNGAEAVFGDRVTPAAQNVSNARARLEICGGRLSGGWIYALAAGSQVDVAISAGEMTTALTPWVGFYPTKRLNVEQTGGLFAPTSLQPLTSGTTYDGTKCTYTLSGGTFVPPNGWTAGFPWLNITVPSDGEATIRVANDALIPSTLTVDGTLRLTSTNADATLTLATLEGTGPLTIAEGTVRLATPAHALESHAFTVARGATYVKADANDLSLTSATLAGSLALPQGGTVTLPVNGIIGGALTVGAGTTLAFAFDAATDVTRETAFFTAAGGITLADGATVRTPSGTVVKVNTDRTQLLFVPTNAAPATAVWTGKGDTCNMSDPANWCCTNAAGVALANVAPLPSTQVIFPESITLTADCDWSAFGTSTLLPRVIDLRGHKLTVSHLAPCAQVNEAVAYVTDTSTGAPGELHLQLAAGTTWTNDARDLRGNLMFVLDGAGTYQDNLVGKTYTGGTRLNGGLYSCVSGAYSDKGDVTVASNATFSANAAATYGLSSVPNYVLAGGTIASATAYSSGWAGLAKVALTADSTLDCTRDFGLIGGGYGETTLDLAGHTLTIPIGSAGQNLWFYNVTATKGTIKVPSGGWFNFGKTAIRANETDFDLNCALNVQVPVTVHDLTMRYGSQSYAEGSGTITITGTYTSLVDYIHNFRLADGAAIDLNARAGAVSLVNSVKTSYALTFAANATITVDVHARALCDNEQLISWTSPPDASVTFVPDAVSQRNGVRLSVRSDGLYATRGGFLIYGR